MDERKRKFLQEKLAAGRKRYVDTLPDKVAHIGKTWALLESEDDPSLVEELHRMVHNLAGSGASFGLPEMGDIAREAEIVLKNIVAGDQTFLEQKNILRLQLDKLQAYVKRL